MEPHYNLPFRTSDNRGSQVWPVVNQSGYAIVPPSQQFQVHQPPQEEQDLRPIQHTPASVQYGQYHAIHPAPPVLPSAAQQAYPFSQQYPVMPAPPLAQTPVQVHTTSLPVPPQILPSQSTDHGPCLACGKSECHLLSHRQFARHVMDTAKRKSQEPQADATPRPSMAVPAQPSLDGPVRQPSLVLDAERDRLLTLWSMEWAPVRRGPERHLFPTKFIDRILPKARNHMPLLQALLAYSGTLWASANNVLSDLASRQQAFAVEVLSQACPTEQEASTDEAMLAATLLLLIYMVQGNGFEVSKHVSGLVHLSKVRGGPYYLGLSGIVAETLIHADHMQAIFFNHEPVWHFPLPPLDIGLPEKLGRAFRKALANHEMDVSLALAAKSVCRVADIFDHASSNAALPREVQNSFSYLTMIAEFQLARCNAAYCQTSTTNECICLALILFNYIVLDSDGAITPSVLQAEYRFWQALEGAESKNDTLSMPPCLYMWMVLMGLTVCIRSDSQYRVAGVRKLRAWSNGAGVTSWDHLKANVLDDYVWLASAQEETFRRIWLEVDGLKNASDNMRTHSRSSTMKATLDSRRGSLVPPGR